MNEMRRWMSLCEAKRPIREPKLSDVWQTPEFKAWFGDSKVVNVDGTPKICIHAASQSIPPVFDVAKQRFGFGGYGFYFTDAAGANRYSTLHDRMLQIDTSLNQLPVFLKIEKPLIVSNIETLRHRLERKQTFGAMRGYSGNNTADVVSAIERLGYDGVITSESIYPRISKHGMRHTSPGNPRAWKHPVYIVYHPNQIKSIFNRTFDPMSDNISESITDETPLQPSSIVASLAPAICAEAQRLYDEWEQDAEGIDEIYGSGGICEQIAEHAIGSVLAQAGINVASGGDDEHATIIAQFSDGVFVVDIPFCIYERGGGYNWRKRPDVKFEPSDVVVHRLETDPAKFDQYTD